MSFDYVNPVVRNEVIFQPTLFIGGDLIKAEAARKKKPSKKATTSETGKLKIGRGGTAPKLEVPTFKTPEQQRLEGMQEAGKKHVKAERKTVKQREKASGSSRAKQVGELEQQEFIGHDVVTAKKKQRTAGRKAKAERDIKETGEKHTEAEKRVAEQREGVSSRSGGRVLSEEEARGAYREAVSGVESPATRAKKEEAHKQEIDWLKQASKVKGEQKKQAEGVKRERLEGEAHKQALGATGKKQGLVESKSPEEVRGEADWKQQAKKVHAEHQKRVGDIKQARLEGEAYRQRMSRKDPYEAKAAQAAKDRASVTSGLGRASEKLKTALGSAGEGAKVAVQGVSQGVKEKLGAASEKLRSYVSKPQQQAAPAGPTFDPKQGGTVPSKPAAVPAVSAPQQPTPTVSTSQPKPAGPTPTVPTTGSTMAQPKAPAAPAPAAPQAHTGMTQPSTGHMWMPRTASSTGGPQLAATKKSIERLEKMRDKAMKMSSTSKVAKPKYSVPAKPQPHTTKQTGGPQLGKQTKPGGMSSTSTVKQSKPVPLKSKPSKQQEPQEEQTKRTKEKKEPAPPGSAFAEGAAVGGAVAPRHGAGGDEPARAAALYVGSKIDQGRLAARRGDRAVRFTPHQQLTVR